MIPPARFLFINEAFQIKYQIKLFRSLATIASRKEPQKLQEGTKHIQHERLVKIAVIGSTNAGKSTFINSLIKRRICPTSTKAYTTRGCAKAIEIHKNCQIILCDTPGLATEQEMKKHDILSESIRSYGHSIQDSDLIGVIHDVSDVSTRNQLHSTVLDTLKEYSHVPSFLVLNKIDLLNSIHDQHKLIRLLTNDKLVPRLERLRPRFFKGKIENKSDRIVGWSGFKDVFMISSTTGAGMQGVKDFLLSHTKKCNWEYAYGEHTDLPPEELIVQNVRARLLDSLPQEISHTLKYQVEFYNVHKGQIITSVQVLCPSKRIERLVCGVDDGNLKQITNLVTSDLEELFWKPGSKSVVKPVGKPVSLTISVIVQTKNNT